MKILFDHHLPFALAHGGVQVQIEQTKNALKRNGIEVEYFRWWDDCQRGDLIHFFGAAGGEYVHQACTAKIPVVQTRFFSETCNRSTARLKWQAMMVKTTLALPFGEGIKQRLGWRFPNDCMHNIVGLEAERRVLQWVYRVPPEKISVVPLGLSDAYLDPLAGGRSEPHLITTGTIREIKNSVALAQMAYAAQIPVLFVGKPYHPNDPYWRRFEKLIDDRWVKYHPHVTSEVEMIALLKSARGFVLMSNYENWSFAAHEAAACKLPMLLQDQNWSRERFGSHVRYLPDIGMTQRNVESLKNFYADAPNLPAPAVKLHRWAEVAQQLLAVYNRILTPEC